MTQANNLLLEQQATDLARLRVAGEGEPPPCTCSDATRGHGDRCPTLRHPFNADGSPKIAPVQGWTPGIPWSLHLEAYDAYRARWSAQAAMIDLEKRGCRGGFSVKELDSFIPGWRDRASEITTLRARVAELEIALSAPIIGGEEGIIQADREAAADLIEWHNSAAREWRIQGGADLSFFAANMPEGVRRGIWDEHEVVQAFAQYRRRFALPAPTRHTVEDEE